MNNAGGNTGVIQAIELIGQSLSEVFNTNVNRPNAELHKTRKTYLSRRNKLIQALEKLGLKIPPQQGLLSLWLPVKSETSALTTLADYGIQAVGGRYFGLDYPAHIRIATNVLPEDKVDYVAKALFWAIGKNQQN